MYNSGISAVHLSSYVPAPLNKDVRGACSTRRESQASGYGHGYRVLSVCIVVGTISVAHCRASNA